MPAKFVAKSAALVTVVNGLTAMATPAGPGGVRIRTDKQPLVLNFPAKTQGPFYALWSNEYIFISTGAAFALHILKMPV